MDCAGVVPGSNEVRGLICHEFKPWILTEKDNVSMQMLSLRSRTFSSLYRHSKHVHKTFLNNSKHLDSYSLSPSFCPNSLTLWYCTHFPWGKYLKPEEQECQALSFLCEGANLSWVTAPFLGDCLICCATHLLWTSVLSHIHLQAFWQLEDIKHKAYFISHIHQLTLLSDSG